LGAAPGVYAGFLLVNFLFWALRPAKRPALFGSARFGRFVQHCSEYHKKQQKMFNCFGLIFSAQLLLVQIKYHKKQQKRFNCFSLIFSAQLLLVQIKIILFLEK
jgi:hypothetical protein